MIGCATRASQATLLLLSAFMAVPADARAGETASGPAWMTGAAIQGTFGGQPLAGTYPTGKQWTENIRTDGSTDYREGEKRWEGRWWVTEREFCFAYPPGTAGGCFRVVRVSPNCFELYDFTGDLGQADIPPSLKGAWNGRMWLTTQPATCEERPVS